MKRIWLILTLLSGAFLFHNAYSGPFVWISSIDHDSAINNMQNKFGDDIHVHPDGSIFTVGETADAVSCGDFTLCGFLSKTKPDGSLEWRKIYGESNTIWSARNVTGDGQGNVYVFTK